FFHFSYSLHSPGLLSFPTRRSSDLRISAASIEIVAMVGGQARPLTLKAVGNSATGETVGDTALFEADADWLKTTAVFDAVVTRIDRKSTRLNSSHSQISYAVFCLKK